MSTAETAATRLRSTVPASTVNVDRLCSKCVRGMQGLVAVVKVGGRGVIDPNSDSS